MNSIEKFIFEAVRKGVENNGGSELLAKSGAAACVNRYKRNEFTTPGELVDEVIKSCKTKIKKLDC